MDPSQILFDIVSNLTGGLFTDLQTAMVALLAIAFICMGLDLLKEKVLMPYISPPVSDEEMSWLHEKKSQATGWEKDLWRRRYNRALSKYEHEQGDF